MTAAYPVTVMPRPEPAPDVAWPEPEIAPRPAQAEEVPANAQALAAFAETFGWHSEFTYARGTSVVGRAKPGPVTDLLSVRLSHPHGRNRIVAVWIGRRFAFSVQSHPLTSLNLRETKVQLGAGVA